MPPPQLPAEEPLQCGAGLCDQRALPGGAELLGAAEAARLVPVERVAAAVVGGAGAQGLAAELGAPLDG